MAEAPVVSTVTTPPVTTTTPPKVTVTANQPVATATKTVTGTANTVTAATATKTAASTSVTPTVGERFSAFFKSSWDQTSSFFSTLGKSFQDWKAKHPRLTYALYGVMAFPALIVTAIIINFARLKWHGRKFMTVPKDTDARGKVNFYKAYRKYTKTTKGSNSKDAVKGGEDVKRDKEIKEEMEEKFITMVNNLQASVNLMDEESEINTDIRGFIAKRINAIASLENLSSAMKDRCREFLRKENFSFEDIKKFLEDELIPAKSNFMLEKYNEIIGSKKDASYLKMAVGQVMMGLVKAFEKLKPGKPLEFGSKAGTSRNVLSLFNKARGPKEFEYRSWVASWDRDAKNRPLEIPKIRKTRLV